MLKIIKPWLLLIFGLFTALGIAYFISNNLYSPTPSSGIGVQKSKQPESTNSVNNGHQKIGSSKKKPAFVKIVSGEQTEDEAKYRSYEQNEKPSLDRWLTYGTIGLAVFTFFLFGGTGILAIYTFRLWKDAERTSKRQAEEIKKIERAFVFIDGFNFELTTLADTKNYPIENLPASYRECPHLWVTRFCVQPRWRNSGNTPTRKMMINVFFGYNALIDKSESIGPIQYVYPASAKNIFLSPQAVTESEFVYIQGIQEIINYVGSKNTIGNMEPIFLIWGRADYEDIFGKTHFIEWCYRIRLDDHKGNGLRATFTQWGEYNRSDEDQST